MAKLSAHNRKELARLSKERDTPEGELTIWEKKTVTLMTDGIILMKRDVRFKPDDYDPKGRFHSYGWKKHGKIKQGVEPDRFIEAYKKIGFIEE